MYLVIGLVLLKTLLQMLCVESDYIINSPTPHTRPLTLEHHLQRRVQHHLTTFKWCIRGYKEREKGGWRVTQ